MKNIIAIVLFTITFTSSAQEADFFKKTDDFLKKHVDESGQVAYQSIEKSPADLDELVQLISTTELKSLSPDTRKAFLINSYNILVIAQVIDLYPIKSPLDNSSFFNGISHKVGSESLTLDQLEKGMLMMEYHDERTHFVLVCAAKSCPPLANYAYLPETVESQLEERTRYVLNLDWFIQVDKKVALSQ
ncbi:MAG: DUF547 domain-containing protein, partial [Bacteroidota bacterium]